MSQVSKYKLNQKIYEQIFRLFPDFIARLSRQGKASVALNTLLSSTERTMVAKRLAIAFMLTKGYTYDEIIDKLKVSRGTVGKISELIKNTDKSFIDELNKISKKDAFSDFLNTINYNISKSLPPRGGNWSTWRRKVEDDNRKGKKGFL